MTIPIVPEPTRRRSHRVPVLWPVTWNHVRGNGLTGEIYDLSETGLFLSPQGSPSSLPRRGDEVAVVCTVRGEPFYLEAVVCWAGRNPAHARDGYGLSFLPTSAYVGEALAFALTSP